LIRDKIHSHGKIELLLSALMDQVTIRNLSSIPDRHPLIRRQLFEFTSPRLPSNIGGTGRDWRQQKLAVRRRFPSKRVRGKRFRPVPLLTEARDTWLPDAVPQLDLLWQPCNILLLRIMRSTRHATAPARHVSGSVSHDVAAALDGRGEMRFDSDGCALGEWRWKDPVDQGDSQIRIPIGRR